MISSHEIREGARLALLKIISHSIALFCPAKARANSMRSRDLQTKCHFVAMVKLGKNIYRIQSHVSPA
jgi:hypothetical protein